MHSQKALPLESILQSTSPQLLAGPILRRTEVNKVCIWVASNFPITLKAEIFRVSDLLAGHNAGAIGVGITKSLRLGKYLHVALAVALPVESMRNTGFPTGTLLAYDIEITEIGESGGKKLGDLGLTSGENSIVYEHFDDEAESSPRLPTFFIDAESKSLNVIHGSCRKLHGKGEDCLFSADGLLSKSFRDLDNRPSALFLTGDQIYADDVAPALSSYLTRLGIELLGWEEKISGVERLLSDIEPGERQNVVKEYARFTAGHAGNHLLGFGEFAAMYLLAWNVENWPDEYEIASEHFKDNNQRLKSLQETKRDLAAVRRVLANIPTYMIFDDHEITDDWNITREWFDNVADSPCGKQIVTNGLIAYWAFQAWGNDPSGFSDDFVRRVVDYLDKNGRVSNSEKQDFEDFIWNFHGWTFAAPTNPLTVFLDCRTQRQYDTFRGPPQLVGKEGISSISRVLDDLKFEKGSPIIFVVPNPVLGFYLVELLQKILASIISVHAVDLENWFANTSGRVRFLTFILQELQPQHCIFLSGDVHFGFTIKAAFSALRENGYKDIMSMTQLTSSALKTTSLVKIAFVSEILGRIRQLFPFKRLVRTGRLDAFRGRLDQRLPDWVEARSIVHTSGSILPPLLISDNNLGFVSIERTMNRISHTFLVRKGVKELKVHQSVVTTNNGRSPLEDNVRARISRI